VNIDEYIRRNNPGWDRLTVLTAAASKRSARLAPAELDELLALYQRTSAQLSHARVHYQDQALTMRLTELVAEANAVLYTAPSRPARVVADFFGREFPTAVWSARWFVVASALITLVPALVMGIWVATSDAAVGTLGTDAAREAYVEEEFEDYYSSAPAAQFSTEVLVNNIRVSFMAFALGIFFCLGTVYILGYNGLNVGAAAGLFHSASVGEPGKFWGLILPHGMLEITAVIVAGAAGLRLGWCLIAPGDKTRARALADEARRSVVIVLGLMLAFIVAGIIEGFVTPSTLANPVRIGIGFGAWLLFVVWVVAYGRQPEGVTPEVVSSERDQSRPVALIRR
jgi:uncharacterized membrane protein SpoIIM required for sporulation